jgi:orotate phosphoribosyltransferase
VLQDPARAEMLGAALGAALKQYGANVVLSPALGGLIIGHEVARALGGGPAAVGNPAVRAIFAERVEKTLTLRRGFTLSASDRIVVIEDVVTTGLSTRETIEVANAAGATVVAAGSIIDRSGGSSNLGVPYHSLAQLALPTYEPEKCPMCAAGSPVTKPGSRT